jgi:hypothetical protein
MGIRSELPSMSEILITIISIKPLHCNQKSSLYEKVVVQYLNFGRFILHGLGEKHLKIICTVSFVFSSSTH